MNSAATLAEAGENDLLNEVEHGLLVAKPFHILAECASGASIQPLLSYVSCLDDLWVAIWLRLWLAERRASSAT